MPKKKRTTAEASVPAKKRRTRDPMQEPTPTGRNRAEKVRKGEKSGRPKDRAQCTAHKRNGDRCSNPPVRGSSVCRMHGGSAPQVKAKANQRLVEMILPALAHLRRIIDSPATSDTDKLKAINMVLNRTGYSERHNIDLGLRTPTPWDTLTNTAFIMRGLDNIIDPAADDRPEALPPSDGPDDEALGEFLAERERRRARDAETRISNNGHDVVSGEVVDLGSIQREALDPFDQERRDRARSNRPSEFSGGPGQRPTSGSRAYELPEEP